MVVVVQLPSVSDSLRPHGLQHTRPPCPLPSPEVCPSSCPLLRWCHSAILSCDALFSTYSQSFPASGTFLTSQLFASDGQNTGVSASAWVLPMTIQSWFSLRFTGLISYCPRGSEMSSSAPQFKGINSLHFTFLMVHLSQPYMSTGKTKAHGVSV